MGNNPETEADAGFDFQLYQCTPSLPAATVSVVIFAVLMILHTWRLLRARAYYFSAFTVGGLLQKIGYYGRIWSHKINYRYAASLSRPS
ncbi:hypothetical protein BFJ68_g16572 [Fusarium oxysporum]|uniref:Uncharacterized protein n=2 Tax=Fusarium oxysporum TaxID=5507 RepID=A0A420PBX4_FUSOX|nr:hypothetical protein BFJ65_g17081 [Fusarium oxysporum f. sp. cepae]RKK24193.1 hypothetical protein BFJ67_g16740 [Fusarium oxysporum f. sp. cepae]RKK27359.1 hypothetical protein BFJ66_g16687 [Fusarium oxysporum f. sp. cepae]RKK65464.1 hypothetical protein BFJ69_g16264 [Fusarium oxysporum]RKK90028.1 hypothetical protein BFJ68_g16572 [Fusarium oxysporum]